MAMANNSLKTIIVAGAGASGCGAAIAAAKTGANVLLVESGSMPGGDLSTGMPILGSYTSRGEKCVGGVLNELVEGCKALPGGYIGPVCDWRTVYGLCLHPAAISLSLLQLMRKYGVQILVNTTVSALNVKDGAVSQAKLLMRNGATHVADCDFIVDATGDANVVSMAGGKIVSGGENGELQPVSLVFRMAGVDFASLLTFVRNHPENAILSENPVMGRNREESAQALMDSGYPYVALSAEAGLLKEAREAGEMFPCTALFLTPTSMETGELCVNATRVSRVNAMDPTAAASALLELSSQVETLIKFLTRRVPGFEKAILSSVAYRLGVRETARMVGDRMLTGDDVLNGIIPPDSVALGSHHVDIHGSGTQQTRIPIRNGGAYGIPFGCLVPAGLKNVLAAGRCIASDRSANGSARVMGTCLATGHAAGAAAAYASGRRFADIRQVNEQELMKLLLDQHMLLNIEQRSER